jgi:thymidine kinase
MSRIKSKPDRRSAIRMIRIATPEQVALVGIDRGIVMITGPMFAGKTTTLQMYAQLAEQRNENVLRIAYIGDNRYSVDNVMVTHDKILVRVDYKVGSLSEIPSGIVNASDRIFIDEGQFYGDIVEFCDAWTAQGKCIYVACLNGTYHREPFPAIARLMSRTSRVEVLSAKCDCGQDVALFTAKKIKRDEIKLDPIGKDIRTNDKLNVEIGGTETYYPCCCQCWYRTDHVAGNRHLQANSDNLDDKQIRNADENETNTSENDMIINNLMSMTDPASDDKTFQSTFLERPDDFPEPATSLDLHQ